MKADLDATGLAIADQRDRDEAVGEAGRLSGRQVLAPLSSDWPAGLRLAKMVGVVMVDWLGWGVLVIIRRSDEIMVGAGIRKVEMTRIVLEF